MSKISLLKFPAFADANTIEILQRQMKIHEFVMPHQIAVATGCSVQESMNLLLFLYSRKFMSADLLVYHIRDYNSDMMNAPFLAVDILQGLPELPLICDNCDRDIDSYEELSFDFAFYPIKDIEFIL